MKINMIKILSHIESIIRNGIEKINEATTSDDIRRLTNYYIGSTNTIIEMSNEIDDDDISEDVAEIGFMLACDVWTVAVRSAAKIHDSELVAKAAGKRDEAMQELKALRA